MFRLSCRIRAPKYSRSLVVQQQLETACQIDQQTKCVREDYPRVLGTAFFDEFHLDDHRQGAKKRKGNSDWETVNVERRRHGESGGGKLKLRK